MLKLTVDIVNVNEIVRQEIANLVPTIEKIRRLKDYEGARNNE
uniref:Uncharacterized protein n=1 Tax=Meloidogyne enterolobii TaxID=390850 RepID=A0A6V7WM64_MELEN|nr:unnamed protein product [Meloidogyne enterolobii]